MKKIIFLFALTLAFVAECSAQEPVFNYTNPTKDQLEAFALGSTVKGAAYRSFLIFTTQKNLPFQLSDSWTSWIFARINLEEVTLEEGDYTNSGWNPLTKKMEPTRGHYFHGMVWVFRHGSISFPLIKGNCGNIVLCKVFTAPKQVDINTDPLANTIVKNNIVYVHDTIHDTLVEIKVQDDQTQTVYTGQPKYVDNTRIVGYGADNNPYYYQDYYYGGNQYYQSCNCGYNFVLGPGFFFGFSFCPHCHCASSCMSYNYGPRYIDNNYWVDYGAVNHPDDLGNNDDNDDPDPVDPDPDDDGDDDDDDNDDDGDGGGTPGWDRSQNQNPSTASTAVQQNQSQQKPVNVNQKPMQNNQPQSKPVNNVQQKPVVSNQTGYTKPQNNGYQLKPKPVVNTVQQKPAVNTGQQKPSVNTGYQKPVVTQKPTTYQRPTSSSSNQNYSRPTNVQKPSTSQNYQRPVMNTNPNVSRSTGSSSRNVSAGRTVSTGRR